MSSSTSVGELRIQDSCSLAGTQWPTPPQAVLTPDDPSAVEPARRRLATKTRFRVFSFLPNPFSCCGSRHRKPQPTDSESKADGSNKSIEQLPPLEQTSDNTATITLDLSGISDIPGIDKDVYRWAVVYENQRGLTVLSSPYYSHLSLLPIDPPQFTIPSDSLKRSRQPNISLSNYALPDGTWRWVSRSWMIDMRTDSGEVQYDGFEYNWFFREKHWHAEIGKLSTGAWVRRRRWVRLMMRPTQHTIAHSEGSPSPSTSKSRLSDRPLDTNFVSLVHPQSEIALDELARSVDLKWEGSEQDWVRCHRLMRRLGRDGRKLELWRLWLLPYLSDVSNTELVDQGKLPEPDSSPSMRLEYDGSNIQIPPLEYLGALLQNHGDAVLRSFVFPDSRAQFVNLVKRAGLARELGRSLGDGFSSTEVDFWSYSKGLGKVLDKYE
ncbi:hypothetical protein DFJ58DRAFT_205262 [Suillus subalutaceus]|uniref:uncharacterized protein n=1 Tax=Suillus subalutaceus TaxID=48586 RepID=UPI001B85EFA3|nr:uncharacterized protein DFJ58DRAFT_205262 [Suillus subalutaceus]KAG1864206.1 hypothetical protein DFJ58DRAFT_205262 [Suillus subalutaceus]